MRSHISYIYKLAGAPCAPSPFLIPLTAKHLPTPLHLLSSSASGSYTRAPQACACAIDSKALVWEHGGRSLDLIR